MSYHAHATTSQDQRQETHYWLIDNDHTSWNERAIGSQEDVDIYLENNPHLCNPRIAKYDDMFEGCIDLWHENNIVHSHLATI
jgi:hypothetical protein